MKPSPSRVHRNGLASAPKRPRECTKPLANDAKPLANDARPLAVDARPLAKGLEVGVS